MEINELDVVKLKDGRTATIVYIPPKKYQSDYLTADVGDTPETWDTIDIKVSDIEEVIHQQSAN